MSLLEPTFLDKVKPYKRWLIWGGLGLLLLGVALFLFQCGDDYLFKKDADKKKEAVNAILVEANQASANLNAEKKTAEEIAANLKVATNAYFDATNVTDATRANVNAAIDRWKEAAKSNKNASAAEVEEAMKGL